MQVSRRAAQLGLAGATFLFMLSLGMLIVGGASHEQTTRNVEMNSTAVEASKSLGSVELLVAK